MNEIRTVTQLDLCVQRLVNPNPEVLTHHSTSSVNCCRKPEEVVHHVTRQAEQCAESNGHRAIPAHLHDRVPGFALERVRC